MASDDPADKHRLDAERTMARLYELMEAFTSVEIILRSGNRVSVKAKSPSLLVASTGVTLEDAIDEVLREMGQ